MTRYVSVPVGSRGFACNHLHLSRMLGSMRRKLISPIGIVVLLVMAVAPANAQEPTRRGPGGEQGGMPPRGARVRATTGESRDAAGPASQPASEEPVATEHEITIDDQPFKYKATAGTLPL